MIRPLSDWPAAIEAVVSRTTAWNAVHVLRETASTQDFARTLPVGSVVIAGRQRAGRGRLGRGWADTGEDGLAMTVTVTAQPPERSAVACAVAAAEAIEELCQASSGGAPRIGFKWPNDLMVANKKLGGILIERHDGVDSIGIGVNCSQRSFSSEIAMRATSLALHGFLVDRLDLACAILTSLDRWLVAQSEQIESAFIARDILCGTRAACGTPTGVVEGLVVGIDPIRGLRVRTSRGDQVLAAATTRVLVPEDRLEL